jgi:tetratricopeptide (TPR) repeat protein
LFAVVAGPVLACNLQDFFTRRAEAGTAAAVPRRRIALRVLAGLIGLIFLACAWPGWLQAPPFEPRRWGFDLPPALQRGGETMGRWQAEGRFDSDARGLHLSSASAHAFAWFRPEHRGFQDDALAAGILDDPNNWTARLRAAGVNHVIVYDTDRERLAAMHAQLLSDPDQWSLLFSEGDLAVFGLRDPSRPGTGDPFEEVRLNFDRLALQPGPGERAPPARPATDPQPRLWWEAFWKPAPPRPIERDAALFHLLHAQAAQASAPYREVIGWETAQLAGLVGSAWSATGPAGLLDVETRLVFFRPPMLRPGFSSHPIGVIALANRVECAKRRDDSPMAVLYLAIRAARRALAVNPQDAQAYAALGEAYLQLYDSTRERAWSRQLPELAQLRRVQAVAALTQAVTLDPNLSRAHRNLATLYYRLGYLDLALKHQRAFLQTARKAGPPPGMTTGQFHDAVTEAEQQLGPLQDAVDERERVFKDEASGARVFDRATVARDLGLVGMAVDILLNSDVSAFGVGGMALELELLVSTGRVKEVREWTAVEQLSAIGAMYHWLRALAFAGSGDYALAQGECVLLATEGSRTQGGSRNVMAAIVAQAVLDEQPGVGGATWLFGRAITRADFRRQLVGLTYELQRAADALVLRGMLALEMGDVDEAEVAFRLALDTWGSEAAARDGRGIDFNARVVAQECLKWMELREPGR